MPREAAQGDVAPLVETPEAPRPPPPDPLALLDESVRELNDLVASRFREEGQNRVAFERLHREMLDYKEDFLQRAQEPMYRSLIRLVDDIDSMRGDGASASEADLEFIRAQVLEILSRQGVEPFLCEVEEYDPARQKAEKSETTPDPNEHRRVLRSLKPGYRIGERTLRPEGVAIRVYRKPTEEQT